VSLVKNNLSDLNNHLFLQLERVNEEGLAKEELDAEIRRSQAISAIAKQIIGNAAIVLKADQLNREGKIEKKPNMIEDKANV
jgi:hypothetical protein